MARVTKFKKGSFTYKRGSGLNVTGPVSVAGATTLTGAVSVVGTLSASLGVQASAQAVTATVAGLTTGLVPAGARFVSVTSADANHIVTLPAAVIGTIIDFWVGANGCEIRTPAASNVTINDVDSDGTNELAIPATTHVRATCVTATGWIVDAWNELGADIAALVPDAA